MKRFMIVFAAAASLAGAALVTTEASAKGGKFGGPGGFAQKHHGGGGHGPKHWGGGKHFGGKFGGKHFGGGHGHWGGYGVVRHRYVRPVRMVGYAPSCYRRLLTPYGYVTRNVCVYY